MQRYFVPRDNWDGNLVFIKGEDVRHIARVMRLHPGDKIICNHPDGPAAVCLITSIDTNTVRGTAEEWLEATAELPVKITIAQGIPKGDKFDFVLQKGTELGAYAFIPFRAERSVAVWDSKKAEKKLQRFSKIVKEAGEQSHRSKLPLIKQAMTVSELINESTAYDVKLFAYEEEAKIASHQSFGAAVGNLKQGDAVLICIGPEGGFSQDEAALLKGSGFAPVRLGPRILRTETAALYALAGISYHFEELRCQ